MDVEAEAVDKFEGREARMIIRDLFLRVIIRVESGGQGITRSEEGAALLDRRILRENEGAVREVRRVLSDIPGFISCTHEDTDWPEGRGPGD